LSAVPAELAFGLKLAQFPATIAAAAEDFAPHQPARPKH
jgi:hypothetical protein